MDYVATSKDLLVLEEKNEKYIHSESEAEKKKELQSWKEIDKR
ncbi:hypothetical protein [Bacillus cereus group sp. BfR-BA-01383]|nr:hypothetical protein [Bacillus cereus group sp. BfR-BA-01383]